MLNVDSAKNIMITIVVSIVTRFLFILPLIFSAIILISGVHPIIAKTKMIAFSLIADKVIKFILSIANENMWVYASRITEMFSK